MKHYYVVGGIAVLLLGYWFSTQEGNKSTRSVEPKLRPIDQSSLGERTYWHASTRAESLRVLRTVNSTNETREVLGNGGVLLVLGTGDWIVIRVIVEYDPDREVAIAKDSAGVLYESKKLFSGGLTWYPRYKMSLTSNEQVLANGYCLILEDIESCKDLDSARQVMREQLGFMPIAD